jgi:F-type H+-transporting ATPase subunit gamma
MGRGLALTKRRMKSVDSTRKITNAMKLVATAKLKKWKNTMEESSLFSNTLITLINDVFSKIESSDSPYIKENDVNKKLYIVVVSTLGLCGGYNYNLFKLADSLIKEEDDIIIIGGKGLYHFKGHQADVNLDYLDLCDHLDDKIITLLCNKILYDYKKEKYQSVNLIYTKYVNSLTFTPTNMKILPLGVKKEEKYSVDIILEPTPKQLFKSLIPFYVKSAIYSKLLEAIVSEQASRRTAMENATNNANEIFDELQIEYNKERQAQITQEITEVVGGANK